MKTIDEMAREADPKANLSEPYCLDHETRAWLERFAALVAAEARADEREACAKVCEKWTPTDVDGFCPAAAAIRARGQA
jgi:hypothetical protein